MWRLLFAWLSVAESFNATPAKLITCPNAVEVTSCMSAADYDAIVTAVRGTLEGMASTCSAAVCPQADWAGCVLRMAGHDFMDFADGQGGADACTDMEDPENAGLPACLISGEHGASMQEIYQSFCQQVSLADFMVIAAEAVIASTRSRHEAATPGAPSLDLRSGFRFGRRTASSCTFAVGRLPNPERGCDAVQETFVDRMGLDWSQAAALMGVHTLGRAKIENSGYHGWWSDPENSRRFNHNYYISLLAKGWIPELSISGNSLKNQWERSDVGRDTSFDGHEMMLNTDLCLAFATGGADTPVLAHEHDCCAWLESTRIATVVTNNGGEYCGGDPLRNPEERNQCCGRRRDNCGSPREPTGPAAQAVLRFANEENAWLESFAGAWKKATENGHAALYALGQCPQSSTGASTSSVSSGVSQTAVSTTAVSTTAVSTTALSSTSGPSSTSATGSDPRSTSAAPETSTAPDSAGNDTPSLAESKAARQTLWGLFGFLLVAYST